MRVVQVVSFLVPFFVASALTHRTLWTWLARTVPGWLGRHERAARLALLALFFSPVARLLGVLGIGRDAVTWIGACATLWHVGVGLAMAPLAIAHAAGWVRRRLAREPSAPAVPSPDEPPADPSRRRAIEQVAGGALVATSGAALGWGTLVERFDWRIEEVPVRVARLPRALDGYTIVQISDVHVGTFIGERELRRGVELIRRARADLVVVTGDIVDHDRAYVPLAARTFGDLRARDGVVCIPGNHDYYTGASAVLDGMRRGGVEVLLNRARPIGAATSGLWIAGVDDMHGASARDRHGPDLAPVLQGVPDDDAIVLLAHQPPYVERALGRVDLQLSGHTHGGQINPGFSPAKLVMRYVAGLYRPDERTQLYVNRGFGTAGPPTRVLAPPEITKIVLVAG